MAADGNRPKLDLGTLIGGVLGVGGILGGLLLEGGKLADIAQLTAGIIVFGGTIGAVMITTPRATFFRAVRNARKVFVEPEYSRAKIVRDILDYSNRARRNGIVSLEKDVDRQPEPFLRKALSLGIDGSDPQEIRSTMELEIESSEHQGRQEAKVFEAAGGYAPTIGIIGAVLGLIQVMKHLENMSEVGHGIAVAFVATVYGVASANLLFLPAANKLRSRIEEEVRLKEMMLEGVCSIVQGQHPKIIQRKLEAYLTDEVPIAGPVLAPARPLRSRTAGQG